MTTVSKHSFVLLFSSSLTAPVFCFCSGNVIYERNCPALPHWGFLPFPGTMTLPRSFTSDLNTAGTALPPLHHYHECTEWSHMYQSVLQNLGVNRGDLSSALLWQALIYSRSAHQQLFHWGTVVEHFRKSKVLLLLSESWFNLQLLHCTSKWKNWWQKSSNNSKCASKDVWVG